LNPAISTSTLGIIPARYASTRFPGKPLAMLGNKPVIQWVYERSAPVLDTVYVATDDRRIYDRVRDFGGAAVMTSESHTTGTDRCAEALQTIASQTKKKYGIVVNIQGDEPFIDPQQIRQLLNLFDDKDTQIATLAAEITRNEDIFDPNKTKLVKDAKDFALLFSRSPIPFQRGAMRTDWQLKHKFLRHIGIYAFLPHVLLEITKLEPSGLEMAESLEQLRWLENGYRIRVGISHSENIGIDTPEDLEEAGRMI
jgi:3-deoxy-manno-octulosonate cytidylyltransferase (CMP-KDO synthetase)